MQLNGATSITDLLLETLRSSSVPISTRDLGVRLRMKRARMPDYEVNRHLRGLLREGQVTYRRGRWATDIATVNQQQRGSTTIIPPPPLRPEVRRLLGWGEAPGYVQPPLDEAQQSGVTWTHEPSQTPGIAPSGRWGYFRRLLAYYRQCIMNEEGADASAFNNQLFDQFIYLRGVGPWYPRLGMRWRVSLPLGSYMAPFLQTLDARAVGHALVLGYPLQGIYIRKEGEPDVAIMRPIFFYQVEHTVSCGALVVEADNPRPDINLGWLEHAFSRNPQRQRSFLSACGFINRWQPNDEMPMTERGEYLPGLDNLAAALKSFLPERVREPLRLESVPDTPLSEPFQTGIYNRAVLMVAKRTKYTQTLLKELSAIEKAPDEELDRTALRYIFAKNDAADNEKGEYPAHEELVADTTLLNAEQRRAVAALLSRNVTVITGPPGTGKSQVVSAAMTNARLRGKSVLFASRNHKAIDAVFFRLTDEAERPLMVRTNSKEDPNLNYTFRQAIREMLAVPRDPSVGEQLARVKEEIASLLEERGQKARYTNLSAEVATELGEMEEKLAYLSRGLPDDMVRFLDGNPQAFPISAVDRLTKAVHTIRLAWIGSVWLRKILEIFHAIRIQPWYRVARYGLCHIPEIPALPVLGTPSNLKKLNHNLSVLEKAMEFSRLRLACQPLEMKARELPRSEELAEAVAQLSSRLAEISPRAVSLDLESRCGLPPGTDREELDGLQAAMHAMQTGLEDGIIRSETVRVLKKRAPKVLEHFPCWAVTNLSAGSRIPLVPGLFDLAIVDEASQSDIPSAIPILFRAQRAGVVGDPFQLTHCSKLSTAKDTMLLRQVGLARVKDIRFAYTESSLYDLFSRTNGAEPAFLNETYRSVSDIANYSNQTFYSGRLRVATDQERLAVPCGMKPGIHWTEICGTIQSGGGSGCYCSEEVEAVTELVRTILVDNDFRGTLGVVTPFRQQANRLLDAIFEGGVPYDVLTRAKVHVDTCTRLPRRRARCNCV